MKLHKFKKRFFCFCANGQYLRVYYIEGNFFYEAKSLQKLTKGEKNEDQKSVYQEY